MWNRDLAVCVVSVAGAMVVGVGMIMAEGWRESLGIGIVWFFGVTYGYAIRGLRCKSQNPSR